MAPKVPIVLNQSQSMQVLPTELISSRDAAALGAAVKSTADGGIDLDR